MKEELEERVRADLHNHLGRGGDFTGFDRVIDIAAERLGEMGIVGIVDPSWVDGKGQHYDERCNRFFDAPGSYRKVDISKVALYVPERKIILVRGQEVVENGIHILVMGLPIGKYVKLERPLEDKLKEARDLGGKVIGDHPDFKNDLGRILREKPELLVNFDGWEVYNSQAAVIPSIPLIYAGPNKKAMRYYNQVIRGSYNIGMVASTDGHGEELIGTSYTLFPAPYVPDHPVIDTPDIASAETFFVYLGDAIRSVKDEGLLVRRGTRLAAVAHGFNLKVWNKLFPPKIEQK